MKKTVQILISLFTAILISNIILKSFEECRLLLSLVFCTIVFLVRNYCYRNFEIFLCILIFFSNETFHLLPPFGGYYIYKQFVLPILIIYVLDLFLQNKLKFGEYGGWVTMYGGLIIFGFINSIWWGQPFMLGIKEIIYHVLFIIYFLVVNSNIDIDKFTKYLVFMGVIMSLLGALQYIFYGKFNIFYVDEERIKLLMHETRGFRIYEGGWCVVIAAVVAFAKYLKKRSNFYGYIFIWLLIYTILIVQTRMQVVGIIVTAMVLYMINRKFSLKAVLSFGSIIIMVISMFPLFSKMDIKIIKATREDFGKHSYTSYTGRRDAYIYYLKQFKKSPLIGYGYWNTNWEKNPQKSVEKRGISFADIGIVHLMITSGILGLIWLFYGMARFIPRILRGYHSLEASAYVILGVTTITTLDYFIYGASSIFIFGIFLGLLGNIQQENLGRIAIVDL